MGYPPDQTESTADASDETDAEEEEGEEGDAALIMPEMGVMSFAEEGLVYFEDGSYSRGAMSVSDVTPNDAMEGQEELTVVFETCLVIAPTFTPTPTPQKRGVFGMG